MREKIEFPKYEDIVKSYNEIVEIIGNERNVNKLKETSIKYNLCLEIDCIPIIWVESSIVEDWVRVDYFKELSYIYFFNDGSILFDIEVGEDGNVVCESVSIKTFTKEFYEKSINRLL